jgi:phosphomannomutase / phosphoglucomutase
MQVPRQVFREYDIRGIADRDLTDELTRALGLGLAAEIRPKTMVVARDCRLSSDRLFDALSKGLISAGVRVIDLGVGPTPMLYFGVFHLNADGGVMITGSHNAAPENGFKIMRGKASFYGADIQTLRERIERDDLPTAPGGSIETLDLSDAYVAALTKDIARPKEPLPFVLDAGNGAGGPLGLRALKTAGFSPDPLFCDMDGHFPNHHPDPTVAKNLEALIARVKSTGARVGLAYDGDADRIGAVDANGDIIWGDKLLILFARDVLAKNPGAAVIGEVKCSQTLYDDIAKHGGRPIMWKTGHSLIKAKIKEEHALLAGEMSGHVFFADRWFGFDDALYAGLRLLEILVHDKRTIGQMLADVPKTFTTPEIRVDCPDAIKFDVVRAVTDHYKKAGHAVVEIDGARIAFPSKSAAPAWGLVRSSNTGPILVMRVEAGTQAELDAIKNDLDAVVANARRERGA